MGTSASKQGDWLKTTWEALRKNIPGLETCTPYLSERLASVLLRRLRFDLRHELFSLLKCPPESLSLTLLTSDRDCTIGYSDFMRASTHGLAFSLTESSKVVLESDPDELARSITECFFKALEQELEVDLRLRIASDLPKELGTKIYCGHHSTATSQKSA